MPNGVHASQSSQHLLLTALPYRVSCVVQVPQANGVHASQSSQPLASLRTLRGALAGTSSSPSDASAGHSLHAEQPQGYKELQQKASEDYLSNYQGLIQDSQSTLQEVRHKLPDVMW